MKISKADFRISEVISEGRSTRFEYVMIFEENNFIVGEGVRKSDYIFLPKYIYLALKEPALLLAD
jgi:hypothetical protein